VRGIRQNISAAYHKRAAQRAFRKDFNEFCRLSKTSLNRFSVKWSDRFPCLSDATPTTTFDTHYIYHCAWAARIIAASNPSVHTDISSDIHLCTLISAFVPVKFYDYRPPTIRLSNLTVGRADLLSLPFGDRSVSSLSCMHVVEHIGLGRYGDRLGPDDDLKAMAELNRILALDGHLLFVVPVGKPTLRFNGCRIYSFEQIVSSFAGLELLQFALIPDDALDAGIVLDADPAIVKTQQYACGCFHFWRSK
jgi:hypothetical protein